MNNPYQAPQSELESNKVFTPSHRGWKLFFWISVLLTALSVVFLYIERENVNLYLEGTILVLYSSVLVGLFGHAYNKAIFSPSVWKAIMVVGIAYDAFIFLESTLEVQSSPGSLEGYLYIVLGWLITLPFVVIQYWGIYLYILRDADFWNRK